MGIRKLIQGSPTTSHHHGCRSHSEQIALKKEPAGLLWVCEQQAERVRTRQSNLAELVRHRLLEETELLKQLVFDVK